MAVDDELGAFTDLSSDYVITGTINYVTGEINLEFEPDTFISQVYVRYQQDANGDVVADNSEVCKLYEVDVSVLAYAATD